MKRVCRPHSRGGWRGTPESIAETEGTEGEGDGPQKGVQRDPRAHSQMGTEGGREGPQTPQQIQRGGTGGYRGTPETPQQIQRGAEGCTEGPQSPQQSQTGGGGRPQTPTPRAELGYSRSATTLLRKDWMYMGMMQKRSPTTGSQGSPRGGGRGGVPAVPTPPPPHRHSRGGARTAGEAAEGFEGDDDVAEEEEEGERALAVVLGVGEEAQAAVEGGPHLSVADVAHIAQPQPNVAQSAGWGGGGGGFGEGVAPTWVTPSMMARKNLRTRSPTTLAFWAMSLILERTSERRAALSGGSAATAPIAPITPDPIAHHPHNP